MDCGLDFTLVVDAVGDVWGMGESESYQAGLLESSLVPRKVLGLQNIVEVSCGTRHSAAVDTNGDLWTFGSNKELALGLSDDRKQITLPTRVVGLPSIVSVVCGTQTLCLDSNGLVWLIGGSTDDPRPSSQPKQLPCRDISAIYGTAQLYVCVDLVGDCWIVNSNRFSNLTKTKEHLTKLELPEHLRIKSVAVGRNHLMILDENNALWSLGNGQYKATGLIDTSHSYQLKQTNIIAAAVSCGIIHTMITDSNGIFWAFGANQQGQLGVGSSSRDISYFGVQDIFRDSPMKQLRDIEYVANGGYHSICKSYEGQVWVFGRNSSGQLGIGNRIDQRTPQLLPDQYAALFWPKRTTAKSARK